MILRVRIHDENQNLILEGEEENVQIFPSLFFPRSEQEVGKSLTLSSKKS